MANIVLGILGPVLQVGEWVWIPVKRGMSYVVHCKRNLHSLGDAVQNLETMLNSHKQSVDIAIMSGDDIKPDVQIWLRAVDNAMIDAVELRGRVEAGEKCLIGWCPDCKWRYNVGKKAWYLTTAVNKLVEEAKFDTVSVEVRRAPEVQNLICSKGFQSFEATRQAMDRVMKALKNDEVTTIGVYGMGGIGKTTLVKQVGAHVCKDGLFDLMIMAVFSQNPVVVQIQDQLKDMLALPLHETTEMARAARLRERIVRGKKILIILDDIWETIDLSLIGIPNEDELGKCGSKVIFTTRIFHVCQTMESQVKIPLTRLSEDDSWDLFVKNTNNKSFELTNYSELAKEVARECGGLPIALVAVARALRDKDQREEWEEAARRLQISQPANLHDDGRVLKCIKLSYDFLKDEDAKACFLLCCLFPEDYNIEIADLIKYALGKGLFRDAATFEEARSRAHSVINYLKSSNLLLDGEKDKQVRMHDVIRDMAMLIAAAEYGDGFLVKAGARITVWPRNAYEDHSAISLMKNNIWKLPEELVCPKLQILLLQNNIIHEIPVAFFEGLTVVKVLDLSNNGISILPGSLSLQTNLKALFLDGCGSLRDVSQLGELKKVEILSLRGTPLKELPEEIGNLGKLRMLDLSWTLSIKRIPSNLISRLSRLEELYMISSFWDWGSKVEGAGKTNAGFEELLGLQYLNILDVGMIDAKCLPVNVSFNPNWAKFHICIGGRQSRLLSENDRLYKYNSRELILDRTINSLPRWFNTVVTQRSQTLTYSRCDGLSDILLEYDLGYLHRLEILYIKANCSHVVTLMDTTTKRVKPVFENLEVLIVQCPHMKELLVGELPQGSLGKLKSLMVDCRNLLNPLVPSNLLQSLQNLEILSVGGATSAENVFRSEDFGQEQIKLEKLREISLYDLPYLENILSGPAGYLIFRNLRTLRVLRCGKDLMKYVFPSEVFQSLSQLENLSVGSCDSLEMIIGPGEGTTAEKIVLAQLTHLALTNLPQLTSFYTNGIECPSLQVLLVGMCPQFPTSTYDFHSRNPVTIETDE